ncbi:hypothetical protein CLOM_g12054 [Closterium sp. NIES-68]|nr:hypothetical protein CLOM_g12054 [Closterium sp. NIES-68]GJP68938.1 hypothetical protein CLOP_g25574 [Closterium sp. NIES-67]GJP72629.1 hypothetical protein CLOP_g3397 [Closterium sp. NIES-67]
MQRPQPAAPSPSVAAATPAAAATAAAAAAQQSLQQRPSSFSMRHLPFPLSSSHVDLVLVHGMTHGVHEECLPPACPADHCTRSCWGDQRHGGSSGAGGSSGGASAAAVEVNASELQSISVNASQLAVTSQTG